MHIEAHTVNSFTDGGAGGNPAGVVIDADGLDSGQKLAVASKMGLSETAFVSKSAVATVKLEFFTPTRQIAHCGHATVATFSLLRQLGRVPEGLLSKETIDGTRKIIVEGDMAFMEQNAPRYTPVAPASELHRRVMSSLGLPPLYASEAGPPVVVNTGNAFLLLALPDEASVARLAPDMGLMEVISRELDLIGYYVFSRATRQPGRHAGARMFAPRYGIPEESGTGMAAGPLACLLHERLGVREREIFIEQGRLMQPPSPCVIKVVLECAPDGRVAGLMAGGSARVGSTQIIEL
jgi:PhzF family phenazine biosynthesis protein